MRGALVSVALLTIALFACAQASAPAHQPTPAPSKTPTTETPTTVVVEPPARARVVVDPAPASAPRPPSSPEPTTPSKAAPQAELPSIAVWMEGHIGAADATRVITSLDGIDVVYPVAYNVQADGRITLELSGAARQVLGTAKAKGITMMPTVQNVAPSGFEPLRIRSVLTDPARRKRHLEQIVRLATAPDMAGVNIDYESLGGGDRDDFMLLLGDAKKLLNARGRRLSVCVPAVTSTVPTWDGAASIDWDRIADVADEVVVMAYDFSWPGGPPGPVAPIGWVKSVVEFMRTRVPIDRLRIGLPLYGYDWSAGNAKPIAQRDNPAFAKRHRLKFRSSPAVVRGFEVGPAPFATYRDVEGVDHTVYIESPEATALRVSSLQGLGVKHVSFWRAAYADVGSFLALGDHRVTND